MEVIQLLHDPVEIITGCSRLKQQLRHLNVNTRTDENERITVRWPFPFSLPVHLA